MENENGHTYEDGFSDGAIEGRNDMIADLLKAGSWHDDGSFVIEDPDMLAILKDTLA